VCTAGKTISERSVKLLKGEDPVLGYVYDVMGSAIADAAGDRMQLFLKQESELSGERITNRYSPGYCQWNVSDQHKLFALFPGSPSGVILTPSALMLPVKSISGVIGIGRNVKYRDYQCDLCTSENCIYRKTSFR
jgi:cobalamin-dependent methionine synthase I